jgi:hypothetical protein
MRYSLRTLLIVVTIIGGPLARIAYLKQMARFHRQSVQALVPILCVSERATPDEIHNSISFMARDASRIKSRIVGHPHVVGIGSTEVIDIESNAGRSHIIQDKATLAEWKQAFAHEIIARRFDRAFFRPWQTVDSDFDRIFESDAKPQIASSRP